MNVMLSFRSLAWCVAAKNRNGSVAVNDVCAMSAMLRRGGVQARGA